MFDYRAVPFAKGFEDASLARGPLVAFVAWAAKAELGDGAGSPSSEMGGEMSVRSRHPALPHMSKDFATAPVRTHPGGWRSRDHFGGDPAPSVPDR
jgi:hypothetical protein